jgi:hypothetical protein
VWLRPTDKAMATSPLTHHDILGLIEPFIRSGRQLDLGASDRVQRCLVFKPETSPNLSETAPSLTDRLEMDCLTQASFVLRRIVTHPDGLDATLLAQGAEIGQLLAALQAVDPEPLFRAEQAWLMACSYRLLLPAATLQLTTGVAQLQGLTLRLKMPAVKGYPAELEITATAAIDLPDDLLQVLGRNWARLTRHPKNWRSSLRLRGPQSEHSRLAASQLETVARHLAHTLAQPPALFHEQQAAARWSVAARRAVPLLTLLGLVLGSLAVPYLGIAQNSIYWMLIFNAPPLLLLWGFSLREMPSFELPRPPRRLSAASWWTTPPVDTPANGPHPAMPVTSAPSSAP